MAIIISGQKRKQRVPIRIKNNRTIKFKNLDKRYANLTIVILENPEPPTGAKLVKTVYRVGAQAKATR
jgi:hypothetical protein